MISQAEFRDRFSRGGRFEMRDRHDDFRHRPEIEIRDRANGNHLVYSLHPAEDPRNRICHMIDELMSQERGIGSRYDPEPSYMREGPLRSSDMPTKNVKKKLTPKKEYDKLLLLT